MAIEEEAIATSVKLFRLFDVDVCMGSSSMLVICDETIRARECGLSLYPKGKSGYHLTAELWRLPASTGANGAPILPRSALAARRKEAQMRWVFTTIVFLAMSLMATAAEEQSVVAAPWQGAITGQIEAFRDADGAGALEFASAGFRVRFADPQMFYEAILASGYEPLINSRSHTFGEFERTAESVFQVVLLVGPDQGLYEAIYQMIEEPEGWRVEGVALRREQGVGI